MADENTLANVETLAGKVMDALADILRTSTSPDALQAQNLLLKRMALEGDVFPSRVPPPKNITEVGGYLNLLETLNETEMRTQALAAILGVAGPNPIPGFVPAGPVLYDVVRANDRPAGAAQPTIPVQFRIRNDFAAALDAALQTIHDAGCSMPILSQAPGLPLAVSGATLPADLLQFLGRTLDLMPTTALTDPDADALAVARLDGTTALLVAARQSDATAANAGSVAAQKWAAWKCDANACAESTADRKYLPLAPVLNAAGWYQPPLVAPAKLASPGNWSRWTNVTGLIAGASCFGDELKLRFAPAEIAASVLRDALDWIWDGQTFQAA
jgi:hypothetical protein